MAVTHETEDNKAPDHRLPAGQQRRDPSTALQLAGGAAAAALLLPALAIASSPVHASTLQISVAALVTGAAALAAIALPRTRLLAATGTALGLVAAWLLSQASYPAAGWLVALILGAGAGMAIRAESRPCVLMVVAAAPTAAVLVAMRFGFGRDAAMALGAAALVAAAAVGATRTSEGVLSWSGLAASACALVLGLVTTAYVGATTPGATWFGSLVSHGSRNGNEVAITFDDGPDPPYSLQIRDILDASGAKGTFFTVGKALDARPDVSKALLDDGQLLANHSYQHDAVSWLDPRYPQLQETQDAFKRNLGVCPALFRPPHGSHTPFMAHVVGDHGMTMVTWDVSAGDWATNDGDLLAKRVLEKVKPGSIILLHDGIDGNIGADRSVILEALPIILDGLRQRGLQPVTLDKLLGVQGYLDSC